MKFSYQKGFSLVELLVAMAISGLVAATVIGFFISQQRAHTGQEQVTFMQQNMRAGLGIMSRELRMAGYDPQRIGFTVFSNPGLSTITFRSDQDGDGDLTELDVSGATVLDPDETITYSLDTVNFELNRNGTTLADGIDALAFVYLYDSDSDGALDTDAGGNVIFAIAGPANTGGVGPLNGTVNWYQVNTDGSTTDTGTLANAADIRAVRIWLLARTDATDRNYTNTNTYILGSQSITPNDQRRRRLLDTTVRCRNMGL